MKINTKQCHYIESPDLCSYLQATVLLFNTYRDIVSGPSSILGLKNGSFYGTQWRKHILALTKLGKSNCIKVQHLRYFTED